MAYELWGMQGVVLVLFAIGVILVLNWATKKKNYLKFIPFSPKGLGVVGFLMLGYVAIQTGWWGYEAELGIPDAVEPEVTPGVTFEAEGSETSENLAYDYTSQVFTCSYYENLAQGKVQHSATGVIGASGIVSVAFTINVHRIDSLVLVENATAKVWAVVPTFYGPGDNASILYAPIDKDATSEKYEVALAPAGITARDTYNHFSVGAGGSRAITVTADLYQKGLCQLDNFDSTDVKIYITGVDGYFTLRFVKVGEV